MTVSKQNCPVTVLVTIHDRRRFVREAMRSIAEQRPEGPPHQVLIVGPKDMEDCKDSYSPLPVIYVPSNELGIGGKVRDALPHMTGEVVAFLEDDDRFLPDKLAAVRQAFSQDAELEYYQHRHVRIDAIGGPVPNFLGTGNGRYRKGSSTAVTIPSGAGRRPIGPLDALPPSVVPGLNLSSIVVRRSLLERISPNLISAGLVLDTFLLYAALAAQGSLYFEPRALSERRVHSSASRPVWGSTTASAEANRFLESGLESKRMLRELLVKAGRPEVLGAFDTKVELNKLIRSLRQGVTYRGEFGTPLLNVLRHRKSFEARSYAGVIPLAGLSLLSPRAGHRAYVMAKRIGL